MLKCISLKITIPFILSDIQVPPWHSGLMLLSKELRIMAPGHRIACGGISRHIRNLVLRWLLPFRRYCYKCLYVFPQVGLEVSFLVNMVFMLTCMLTLWLLLW